MNWYNSLFFSMSEKIKQIKQNLKIEQICV